MAILFALKRKKIYESYLNKKCENILRLPLVKVSKGTEKEIEKVLKRLNLTITLAN